MADAVRFGDYTFPITLLPQGASSGQNLSAQTRRRASGSITQVGKREVTLLPIRGDLFAATPDDLKALVTQIKAAVYKGKQPLWYGDSDWYYRDVQLETEAFPRGAEGRGPWYSVSLTFKASDYPEQYKTTATTWTFAPGGGTVTVEGDSPTQPLWSITIGNAGTGALTLLNAASGETAVLDPGEGGWAAGDVITLNRDTESFGVRRNGAAAFGLLQYRIPYLMPGDNAVWLSPASGATATVAAFTALYQPRKR